MRRGTTPSVVFNCSMTVTSATIVNIVFVQNDEIVIEKDLDDVTLGNKTITVHLTEAETLALEAGGEKVKMQIRLRIGTEKYASNIMTAPIGEILKDGELE